MPLSLNRRHFLKAASTSAATCTTKALCLMAISVGLVHQSMASDDLPGLIGIQYGSDDFEEAQHLVSLDSLDHRWSEKDDFGKEWAGRWRGSIVGPTTGLVHLIIETNQDAIVQIGGQTVLDTKKGWTTGQVKMVKGQEYPITLTYFKDGRGYDCELKVRWTWARQLTDSGRRRELETLRRRRRQSERTIPRRARRRAG